MKNFRRKIFLVALSFSPALAHASGCMPTVPRIEVTGPALGFEPVRVVYETRGYVTAFWGEDGHRYTHVTSPDAALRPEIGERAEVVVSVVPANRVTPDACGEDEPYIEPGFYRTFTYHQYRYETFERAQ